MLAMDYFSLEQADIADAVAFLDIETIWALLQILLFEGLAALDPIHHLHLLVLPNVVLVDGYLVQILPKRCAFLRMIGMRVGLNDAPIVVFR
jgi:hypothetical protein